MVQRPIDVKVQPGVLQVLVVALLGLLTVSAQAMDLMQAYEAAKKQDAVIRAARAAADAGREKIPQAKAALMPTVSASVTHNSNQLSSVSGNETGTSSNYTSGNRAIMVRQPLYRPYYMAQLRQANAEVANSNAVLAQGEQDLPVRVSSAYFEALLTTEQLALVLSQREAYSAQVESARKLFAGGSGTRTDIDEAQARLDMTLALEVEARENKEFTLRQLQTLVNEPVEKLAGLDVSRLQLVDPTPNRLEDWIAMAELNSPQLQALRARVEVARLELEKTRTGHYPTLDAVAQWSRSQSENVNNVNSSYINRSIGLQLNVPIYAGGYVNSVTRQTLSELERAQEELEAGRRDLTLKVHKEFRTVIESIAKVRALEQASRSADQLVLSSKRSLEAGSRTVIDVLNAEQQRMGVLRDLAQARFIYILSKIRLNALAGSLDDQVMQAMNSQLMQ